MKNLGKSLGRRYADMKSNDKKGFTLIELVVVIAIMAILALIMVPNLTAYIKKADDSKVQASLKNVHTAAEMVIQTEKEAKLATITADGNSVTSAFTKKVSEFTNVKEAELVADYEFAPDGDGIKITLGEWSFNGKEYGPATPAAATPTP